MAAASGPPAVMGILLGCAMVHLAAAQVVPSAWWVPDVTLVGLVLAVARTPSQWLACSLAGGLLMCAWAIRFSGPVLVGYLLLGWALQRMNKQWDATDLRVQGIATALGSLWLTLGAMWLDELWSLALGALAVVHVTLTVLTAMLIRRLRLL